MPRSTGTISLIMRAEFGPVVTLRVKAQTLVPKCVSTQADHSAARQVHKHLFPNVSLLKLPIPLPHRPTNTGTHRETAVKFCSTQKLAVLLVGREGP